MGAIRLYWAGLKLRLSFHFHHGFLNSWCGLSQYLPQPMTNLVTPVSRAARGKIYHSVSFLLPLLQWWGHFCFLEWLHEVPPRFPFLQAARNLIPFRLLGWFVSISDRILCQLFLFLSDLLKFSISFRWCLPSVLLWPLSLSKTSKTSFSIIIFTNS